METITLGSNKFAVLPKPLDLVGSILELELSEQGIEASVLLDRDIVRILIDDNTDLTVLENVVSKHKGSKDPEEIKLALIKSEKATLRTKCDAVLNGQDTFTASEIQKAIAALLAR